MKIVEITFLLADYRKLTKQSHDSSNFLYEENNKYTNHFEEGKNMKMVEITIFWRITES